MDVNVHPTKTEVKFRDEHEVFDGVYYAALSALEGEGRSASLPLSESTKNLLQIETAKEPGEERRAASAGMARDSGRAAPSQSVGGFTSRLPSVKETASLRPRSRRNGGPLPGVSGDNGAALRPRMSRRPKSRRCPKRAGTGSSARRWARMSSPSKAAACGSSDKHAAHERIHFDRLKREKQVTMSQMLLDPIVFDAGPEDTELLLENAGLLERLGFLIEAFGAAALAVREIPADIDAGETESLLGEMAGILRRGGRPDDGTVLDALRQSVACKAAVKGR